MLKSKYLYVSVLSLAITSTISIATITARQEAMKEVKKELSELQKLKSELLQTRVALTQCNVNSNDYQAKLASIELTAEQSKLEEDFRTTLKPVEGSKFNWNTMKFDPPVLPTKLNEKTIK